jgi:hypothetical protein
MILLAVVLGWPVACILWHTGRLLYYRRQRQRLRRMGL